MNKFSGLFVTVFLITMFSSAAFAEMGIPIQLRLKSPTGSFPTENNLTIMLQVLSPATNCVLREEIFSNQVVTSGSVSLTLGAGTRSGFDPNLSLNSIFDNVTAKSALTCVDSVNNILSSNQTFTPTWADHRVIRFTATVSGENVRVDFPMKAVPYAIQAESVGGKAAADILVQNGATALNQANLENVFANTLNISNLLAMATTGTAITSTNFSGVLAGDISGSQGATSVDKIKGIPVSNSAPLIGQMLQFDGLQYTPSSSIANATNATNAVNFTGSVAGDVSGNQSSLSVDKIKGVPVSVSAPTAGQTLTYNGTEWVPTSPVSTFAKASADQTFGSNVLANAAGLSFNVVAGKTYKYRFNILYTSAAAGTGLRLGLTYPAVTTASGVAKIPTSATDGTGFIFAGLINSSGDSVLATATPAAAPNVIIATVEGIVIPSAAGTVQLRAASEINASNVVIKAGSFVEINEIP